MKSLNETYSRLSMRRRYEVWFLRFALADGSGAWWFRYLLTNPGRAGCGSDYSSAPVQVWATWFPRTGKPESFIQSFPLTEFRLSARGATPFHFEAGPNCIGENSCRGLLNLRGRRIAWDLNYHSNFRVTLSRKGWIGFSRTPHSDAVFSGEISLDDRTSRGDALGYGLQGHNCGYRHRHFWTWTHAYFNRGQARASTFEALVYEMPLSLVFRKAVLWHEGEAYEFRDLRERRRDRHKMRWSFDCCSTPNSCLEVEIDGQGPSIHRLAYVKTDCSGTFEVANNSLSRAVVRLRRAGRPVEDLVTGCGAVLEMVGGLPEEPETSTEPTDWPG